MTVSTEKMIWKVKVEEALGWELYKTCLEWELTDRAEEELQLGEMECTAHITVDGEYFVVTFREA